MGGVSVLLTTALVVAGCSPWLVDALYDEAVDKVAVLGADTFRPAVLGAHNAWLVQFYNSWCGHCISYKPIWKEFAQDVQGWGRVVKVGVVDCSITANEKICRDYEVHAFPTIKFFDPQSTKENLGLRFIGQRTPESLRQQLIDTLANLALNGSFPLVSNFIPTKKENVVSQWFDDLSRYQAVMLIVEDNNSYTGREVMLDLIDKDSLKVVHILPTDDLILSDGNVTKAPAVLLLERNGSFHYVKTNFDRKSVVEFAKAHLQAQTMSLVPEEELGNGDEGLGAGNNPNESHVDAAVDYEPVPDGVYLVDLENAVRYSFVHEVQLRKQLSAEETRTLRDFVNILVKYFPGQQSMISFFQKLLGWLNERPNGFPMTDYLSLLSDVEIADPNITVMQPWMGCRGSQPNLRGYPCSLWLLFHTLTVESYNKRGKDPATYDPLEVLLVMRDYVKRFFSCRECSQHFQAMSVSLRKDVVEAADGVLWLWQAHNKVNARLHGTLSEDPKHVKLQFPSSDLCPFCQVNSDEGGQWDLAEILSFLTKRYSRQEIVGPGDAVLPKEGKSIVGPLTEQSAVIDPEIPLADAGIEDANKGSMKRNFQSVNLQLSVVKMNDPIDIEQAVGGGWAFNTVDVSLCVMLYGCSALVMLTVYFVVVVKRRLRKKSTGYKVFGLA